MNESDIAKCRILADQYIAINGGGEIGAQLGAGGSAVVFCWELLGVERALKVYNPNFFSSSTAQAERYRLDLQRRLIGKHCPSMVDTLAVDEALTTCFVTMEFFSGVELKKVIGKVPDDAVAPLIGQLVEAVRFLESLGLVHRDIKPENILVSSDFSQLRLLDLGVVREISSEEDRIDGTDHGVKRPFIATAQYSSPEYLFRLEPPSAALWKALTIYQVGGVLHDLVCKRSLFENAVAAENKYALAMAVMREPPDFTDAPANLSSWAALAARCLTKDGGTRINLVGWDDFTKRPESAKEKLERTLSACSENADRAALDEMQARNLGVSRTNRLAGVAESLRNKLISNFSPRLRVTVHSGDGNRICLFLKIGNIGLGVKLAIECVWDSGVRQNLAIVHMAAIASLEQAQTEFSGQRRAIGEIDVDGSGQEMLLEAIFDSVSQVLVKHMELTEVDNIAEGADLVALSW